MMGAIHRGQEIRPLLMEHGVYPMRILEKLGLGVIASRNTRLIGDNDQPVSQRDGASAQIEDAVHPLCRGRCGHIAVIDVDDAIPIEEQRRSIAACAAGPRIDEDAWVRCHHDFDPKIVWERT